jgi:glycerate dehydrogenase
MKTVVLDAHTLNPGDLAWDDLKSLGPCDIHDRTPPADIVARAAGAEILLTNKTPLTREHLQNLPALKYIGVLATGTNVVDLAAARERRIIVTNVPAYGTKSVAQTTIALLLELTQHVGHHAQTVRAGRWTSSLDWCYWDRPLIELDGLTLGIIGLGRIGRAVADLASAFGMNLLTARSGPAAAAGPSLPHLPSSSSYLLSPVSYLPKEIDLDTLFRQSDVISLHCPLTPQTRNLVNAERLALMKPTAFLLNTSRGPLVDEPALADALNSGRIAGAGLDVLSIEPPPADNPLLHAKNCLITPHLAWATRAARSRLLKIATANLRAFLAGEPQNVVN